MEKLPHIFLVLFLKDKVAESNFAFNLTDGYFAKNHQLLKSLIESLMHRHPCEDMNEYLWVSRLRISSKKPRRCAIKELLIQRMISAKPYVKSVIRSV